MSRCSFAPRISTPPLHRASFPTQLFCALLLFLTGTMIGASVACGQSWSDDGSGNIYYDSGWVGVNTNSPSYPLEVSGSIFTDRLYSNGFRLVHEDYFPNEGSIHEGPYGTYAVINQGTDRRLRFGVSNDHHTKAEIEIENLNDSKGWINFKTTNSAQAGASQCQCERGVEPHRHATGRCDVDAG